MISAMGLTGSIFGVSGRLYDEVFFFNTHSADSASCLFLSLFCVFSCDQAGVLLGGGGGWMMAAIRYTPISVFEEEEAS